MPCGVTARSVTSSASGSTTGSMFHAWGHGEGAPDNGVDLDRGPEDDRARSRRQLLVVRGNHLDDRFSDVVHRRRSPRRRPLDLRAAAGAEGGPGLEGRTAFRADDVVRDGARRQEKGEERRRQQDERVATPHQYTGGARMPGNRLR